MNSYKTRGGVSKMKYYNKLKKCKICGSKSLTDVIEISPQYLSSTFIKDNTNNELSKIKIPLTLALCDRSIDKNACSHLQLKEEILPDLLYSQYFYRSSTNTTMQNDLRNVIEDIQSKVNLKPNDIVVDIGANDCTMLSFYPSAYRRVGIEPAKNIDWSHIDKSISILNGYFESSLFIKSFPNERVKAFSCCAMFYDLENPHQFVSDIKKLLHPEGIWCIQLSYLPLMFKNLNFYDICHEHLSYYSLEGLEILMSKNGLKIFDASTNAVNGGSIRVFVTHEENNANVTSQGLSNLEDLRKIEASMDLDNPQTYRNFFITMQELSNKVIDYIRSEIQKGNKVLGLGASTKGNVLIQFFGITKNIMPYISEKNPDKVGLRTMGTDIELISEEQAREMKPSVMLVLPWYFKDEIVKRESSYIRDGGSLLFPMPYAHIVNKEGEISI